jgi:menaquinone-dependent protoporphyrinogen oxidase
VKALVTTASQQGATYGIAEAIGRRLRAEGLDTTVAPLDEITDADEFDAFVIGSAIYTGHWLDQAIEFVQRFISVLSERPVWLFSSGPVGDPRRKLVQKMTADPVELPQLLTVTKAVEHRIFAGKLVGKGLSGPRRLMLIMFRDLEGDWRDWRAIDEWACGIAAALTKQDREATRPGRIAEAQHYPATEPRHPTELPQLQRGTTSIERGP